MLKHRIRSCTLSAFACWLILLASGDDFNLARVLLLPTTLDSEGRLPLDDPNTDFTKSSKSRVPTTTHRDRGMCTSSVGQSWAIATLTSPFGDPSHGHPPRPCHNTPLRC
jgi:hypothetical protein